MTSVRTVTTVQTTGGSGGPGDSNLDALLEDLQTSVGRSPAINGVSGGNTKIYREVTRTVKHETKPGYQQQVEYLQPANTTTVVAERVPSPGIEYITQTTKPGMTSYKTVSYEYNTSNKTKPVMLTEDPNQDARLRQNLTELDSLLVDLHQAQRAGFGTDQGGRGRSRSTDVVPRGGVDPGLLEALDSGSPAPPARQQHVSRVVQERTYHTYNTGAPRENTYSTIQTTRDNTSPGRYQTEPSPRMQPKRSTSVNRELIFNESSSRSTPQEPTHQRARSPSPLRREPESPHVPRRNVQKEVYYETKTSTTGGSSRQPRSTSTPHERYRDKSPSNQRLHREVYGYETKPSEPRNNSVPASPRHERYHEISPPSQRRNPSPSPVRNAQTTVRTYNYSTTNNNTTTNTHTSPRPYRSPSPIMNRSPGVENAPIIELPRRSPSPNIYQNGPNQPPTKVTTTVRTYTYELPGQPGSYPPGSYPPGSYPPGHYPPGTYTVQEPSDYPDRPLTYQVSPNPPKEREPLIPAEQPPTVITYKYSSHSSRNTNVKYPPGHGPDDQQNHLPRPFPTPSPTPGPDGQPPKQLDELMASFDTTDIHQQRHQGPPPGYLTSERQASEPRPPPAPEGVAVVAPTSVKPAPANNSIRNRGSSKNVAGPPVYYPPGVELFAQKDQEAKMVSSKDGGQYEYSRESQSKGSSGGAAVVPVCLPLCCAMPCVIM